MIRIINHNRRGHTEIAIGSPREVRDFAQNNRQLEIERHEVLSPQDALAEAERILQQARKNGSLIARGSDVFGPTEPIHAEDGVTYRLVAPLAGG